MKNYKVYRQVLIAFAGNLTFTQAVIHSLSFLYYLSVNGGAFIHGISLGWSAPTGPLILDSNHDFEMTQQEFSWSVSMMSFGCAMSCVISGIIRNRFGTRFVILVFALPNLLGWLSILFAWRPLMVIL